MNRELKVGDVVRVVYDDYGDAPEGELGVVAEVERGRESYEVYVTMLFEPTKYLFMIGFDWGIFSGCPDILEKVDEER